MSEQAAETQRIVDGFKAANEEKTKLEKKIKLLGESLYALAKTLTNPDAHIFYVDQNDSISVGQPGSQPRRPLARVTPDQIDWKDLCETLHRYGQVREDRQRSAAQLQSMGIKVADK